MVWPGPPCLPGMTVTDPNPPSIAEPTEHHAPADREMTMLEHLMELRTRLVAAVLAGPVLALDPQRAVSQYKHTRWTVEDGAPGSIEALAQTPDGYLWLGTPLGLYRFDGVNFEPMRPPRPALRFPSRLRSPRSHVHPG